MIMRKFILAFILSFVIFMPQISAEGRLIDLTVEDYYKLVSDTLETLDVEHKMVCTKIDKGPTPDDCIFFIRMSNEKLYTPVWIKKEQNGYIENIMFMGPANSEHMMTVTSTLMGCLGITVKERMYLLDGKNRKYSKEGDDIISVGTTWISELNKNVEIMAVENGKGRLSITLFPVE